MTHTLTCAYGKQAGAYNALEYLCCAAPVLLPTLPSTSLKRVLATSKGLRSQVHNFVKAAAPSGHSNAKLLLSRDWPSLHELSLDCPPHAWQGGKRLHQRCNKALLRLLGQGKWPLLRLKISGMSLDSIHEILLLQQGQWSELETLHLSFCSLTEHSIAQLAAGPWHHLRHLNLMGSKLKAADLQQLSNGDWPELRSLKLESISYETMLPPSAQQQAGLLTVSINVAAWPKLTSLVAHNFGNHTLNILWLTCSCFPKLQILDASGARICSDNLQMITKGEWPELLTLKL